MASFQIRLSKKRQGLAIQALILIVFIFVSYFLIMRLISQLYYQKAMNHVREGYYLPAAEDLEKAICFQPDYQLGWWKLGRAYGKLADLYPVDEAFPMAGKSKQACSKAAALNPLDERSAFCLALAEIRLEFLYAQLHPDRTDNPYHPLPYFQQAIRLRPNSISNHYTLARYLYQQKQTEELPEVITTLTRMYPSGYNRLKKEAFWSPAVREAAKKGIEQAIEQRADLRNAHSTLSSILVEEKDWAGAISQLQKASAHQPFFNNSGHYSHLGRLFLENGQVEEAEEAFIEALYQSDNPAKDLEGFLGTFARMGFSKDLPGFYEEVKNRFSVSDQMNILIAKAFFHAGMVDQARRILNELNRKDPSAGAWYWLARIAEREKDGAALDYYEKAVTLAPENKDYQKRYQALREKRSKLKNF